MQNRAGELSVNFANLNWIIWLQTRIDFLTLGRSISGFCDQANSDLNKFRMRYKCENASAFFKWANPGLLFIIFVFSCTTINIQQPAGFELGSSEQQARALTTRPPPRPENASAFVPKQDPAVLLLTKLVTTQSLPAKRFCSLVRNIEASYN